MVLPKEAIYDEQVFPLMKQILDICKQHRIAMLASFDLGKDSSDDDSSRLLCTSHILEDDCEPFENLLAAKRELFRQPTFMALTVTKGEPE